VVQQTTRESNVSISDLNQMSNTLSHESTLLGSELSRFTLPSPSEGGTLTTSTVLWQQLTFDPINIGAAALGYMSKAIHSTLVIYGEGAELMPGMAERWEVLEQGHVYRFHLRRGVRFHNGRLFEAKDVHDSLVRLLLPELGSGSGWLLLNVRGAKDVIEGRTRTLAGIVARDQSTVDIILDEPLAFFLSLLTMHEVGIIPAEEARDREHFRLHAAGAGPFRVEEAIEGKLVRMKRNRDFYVPGMPHLDELNFRLDLRSFRDVAEAFLRDEIDIAHGVPLKMVRELREDPRYAPYMLTTVQLHTSYFGYDCSVAPFNKREVRQAINYAINRERINNEIFAGLGVISRALLPPGLLGYDENLHGYDYDPERARSLLRQAGYDGGFRAEYRTWDSDEFKNSGQLGLIVEDLAAVGIEVNLTEHSATDARKPLAGPGHGLFFTGNWYADFPDSDNFFYVFFHSDANALRGFHYHRDDWDALMIEARRTNDMDRRAEIYRQLDKGVIEEAPLVPLFHERFFVLHKPSVRGLRTSLVPPPVRYADVWLET
jgi:peptide/nickel transport system substrate-binding protein/oligopeptide transport system substrate-binding protein